MAYVNEAHEDDVVKLFGDLLDHYELHYQLEIDDGDSNTGSHWADYNKQYQNYYKKCRAAMVRIKMQHENPTDSRQTLLQNTQHRLPLENVNKLLLQPDLDLHKPIATRGFGHQ